MLTDKRISEIDSIRCRLHKESYDGDDLPARAAQAIDDLLEEIDRLAWARTGQGGMPIDGPPRDELGRLVSPTLGPVPTTVLPGPKNCSDDPS